MYLSYIVSTFFEIGHIICAFLFQIRQTLVFGFDFEMFRKIMKA